MILDGEEYLTIIEFATRYNVTRDAVEKRLKGNRIPHKVIEKRKYIPLVEGDAAWALSLQNGGGPKSTLGKKKVKTIYDLGVESRADKAVTEAKLKDLEYREKARELVRVSEVKKALVEVAASIRSGLENFADRTHIQLAAMVDPNEVYDFLMTEVQTMMENFSNADKWRGTGFTDVSDGTSPEEIIVSKPVGGQKPGTDQASVG